MKLTLKHLSPYLPYGLKVNTIQNELISIDVHHRQCESMFRGHLINIYEWDNLKPILRPLSDLTKEIEVGKPMFFPSHKLIKHIENDEDIFNCDYNEIDYLIRNHFDVFGLIENNLAISYNTIK